MLFVPMSRLRDVPLLLLVCCILLAGVWLSSMPVSAARPLSARVAHLLTLDDADLMALAEQPAEPHEIQQHQQQQQQHHQQADQILIETTPHHTPIAEEQQQQHSLAETQSQSEAQVEAEVTAQAAQEPAAEEAPAADAAPAEPAAEPAADPAADPAAADPAAAAAPPVEEEKPAIPLESAKVRLEKAKIEIKQLEEKIVNQTAQVAEFTSIPLPMVSGEPVSSGANYFTHKIFNLKSSEGIVAKDNAAFLTQTDARCVICQYIVQQAMGLLAGKPLATGGATAGGKRAAERAAAAAPASPAAPTAFLEMESELEMDAERNTYRRTGRPVRRERTRRSRRAPRSRATRRRSSRGRRIRKDFGGRTRNSGFGRRPYMGQNLRLMNPITYPRQLNDFGFDENARNRQADILAHRPRQARFSRGELKAAQAKWDATRAEYTKLYSGVYAAFEKLCSKRMPLAYSGYCTEMMKDYRYIAQGIQYGDRAQSICMNGNWCDRQSYIRHAVHAYFVRESGDN